MPGRRPTAHRTARGVPHGADSVRAVRAPARRLLAAARTRLAFALASTSTLALASAPTLALALALAPAPASAATVGMSDGRPAMFDAGVMRELNFQHVRLVLPWDAARSTGTWTTWLARATADGWPILIAPTVHGAAPSAADYEAALRELLERYPAIDAIEGWNEPNHSIQPTAGKPALAAAYYEAARRACGSRCTAVAGNLLDAPSMATYLAAYRAALTSRPTIWGIHNYYDSTYFSRSGIDQMLAITDGPIWLTETGGLVSFQPNGPGTGLLPDEHRAADGLRWLFTLAAQEPRITRMYLYGMWQQPWNPFDSALVRVDNTEREGMQVVRERVGRRPASPDTSRTTASPGSASPGARAADTAADGSAALAPATPVLRLVGKRITVNRTTRRAQITMRCILATCAGRLTVRAGRWAYARDLRLQPGATRTITIRLSRPGLSALRGPGASASAQLCAAACSAVPLRLG